MFARFAVLLILGVTVHFALGNYNIGRIMSQPGNVEPEQGVRTRCKTSAAFALAGWLEVAHYKATGRRRVFSVQEMVDCYHKQCQKARMSELVNWLIVNDRLSPKDKYTEYKGKAFTCRAGTSPDGLTNFKVTGQRKITPDDFEREIRSRGTVMACVDTTVGGCPDFTSKYNGGVIQGNSSRASYHCTEDVLIVGYDSSSYRVRASRGREWGEQGYFRIPRGGNTCGIEQSMTVLDTEARRTKPGLNSRTFCPAKFPKYCTKIRSCKSSSQRCSTEQKQRSSAESSQSSQSGRPSKYQPSGGSYKPLPEGYRPSGSSSSGSLPEGYRPGGSSSSGSLPEGYRPGSSSSSSGSLPEGYRPGGSSGYQYSGSRTKRDEDSHSTHTHGKCQDHPDLNCAQLKSHCIHERIREQCGATCGVCHADGTPKCKDTESQPGECAHLSKYCATIPGVRVKCALTCNADPTDCEESSRPSITYDGDIKEPPKGLCYPPTIPNGRVLNGRGPMNPGDKLRIQCNPGYTLTGEVSTCEIQNVFAPDTRRLQTCIRLGGEVLEGNGANYNGELNMAVSNRVCDNWLELAHTGLFRGLDRGLTLIKGGNHNLCRNIGGEDFTPFCYTSSGQIKEYCFALPGCGGTANDKCSSVRSDVYDSCASQYDDWSCELEDERARSQTEWYWSNCAAMCCSYAGCQ